MMDESRDPGAQRGWPVSRRQFIGGAAGALTIPGLLAACGGSSGSGSASTTTSASSSASSAPGVTALPGGTPKPGGTLRAALISGGKTETLDPALSAQEIDVCIDYNLYAQLVLPSPTGEVLPYLATVFEPNADATVWQIKIHEGATFHSGRPLTVDDVLATWKRAANPKTGSAGAPYVANIDFTRTKKVSPTELRVQLMAPQSSFSLLMVDRTMSITPADFNPAKPDGSGPFKYVSWQPGVRGEWARFDNFFISGQPYVNELVTLSIADSQARLNALIGGQADCTNDIEGTQVRANASNSQIVIYRSYSAHSYPYYMDTTKAPFSTPAVRQALRLAIDRPTVLEVAFLGYGEVGNDLFGKPTWRFYDSSLPQRQYDPEKAKALLKQAGMENLQVTLQVGLPYAGQPQAELAFAQQAKAAGITINVNQVPIDKYFSDIYLKQPFGATDWSTGWDTFFPQCCLPKGPYNETNFQPPQQLQLYQKIQSTTDPDKQKQYWADIQQLQWNEGGYIIWGFADEFGAVSPRLRGMDNQYALRLGGYQFRKVWFE